MPWTVEQRKERLFERLHAVYDEMGALSAHQTNTGYGCRQSGRCCQVGLELHWMECENIARGLRAEDEAQPGKLARRIDALKHALKDDAWTAHRGYGDFMCAMYDQGCTIYNFRPAVCRMYGPLLPVDDECPRERMGGRPFVYFGEDVDDLVRRFYRVLDDYGKLVKRDRAIYMPAGVLTYLLDEKEIAKLKAATEAKFWRTSRGYRTQFKPEKSRMKELREIEERVAAEAPASPFPFLPAAGGAPRI